MTFGHGTLHILYQIHDGWHLADSSVNSYLDTAGPAGDSCRVLKRLEPTYHTGVRHIENYGCFKGAWQCYTSVLSCLYCFYFPSLWITEPVENQPNRIPCLKIQHAMDDVGFAYTRSLPYEISYPAFRSSAAAGGKRSLHTAFSRVLLLAGSALPLLLSSCWAIRGARQLSTLTMVLTCRIKQEDSDTRGLLFCFRLSLCHAL